MTPQHHPVQTAGADLTCERFADHTVIAISGELDVSSTPSLRERLYVALRDPGMYVVIDLSGMTFCDASGLAMLVGAQRRLEGDGTGLILARPRPHTARLLRVTGLSRAFTVRPPAAWAPAGDSDPRSAAA
ncbi:anti-sigma factor antagonist [Actinomadura sp. KC06]|uniref:STAS domain-containing protein n=1 Tax=Actinomadura sp. KC06 TaxID=2530369 RepID=UPI0010456066|nr:STAS domain-containing protein [Actinomadura sp. KC06]TDD38679.1 anti-sigma factor antagonist [Actinomadura sp. KC06]